MSPSSTCMAVEPAFRDEKFKELVTDKESLKLQVSPIYIPNYLLIKLFSTFFENFCQFAKKTFRTTKVGFFLSMTKKSYATNFLVNSTSRNFKVVEKKEFHKDQIERRL